MASAGNGGIGEAEAAAAASRRTIYDYLGDGEDGGMASQPSLDTPPRLRLPRFTCARIRFGRLGRKRGGRGGPKEPAEKSEDASVDSSGWNQAAGGRDGGGVSVAAGHTGMGLSMLLLLARTCVELNRMAEVRAQMEALLKEIRDEASRVKSAAAHDDIVAVAPPKPCNDLQSSSNTTASSSCVSDTSTTNCLELGRGADGKRAASESEDEGCAGGGTDVLEEVEARTETEPVSQSRRQPPAPECKCDTDTEQETPESSSDEEEFIELAGGRFGTGGSSQRGGAVDDESDGGGSCEGGVPAAELERRLHELRHRRDRERIEALEAALRRARRKLTEKEMEARLWQDTAALALGRPAPRDGHGQ